MQASTSKGGFCRYCDINRFVCLFVQLSLGGEIHLNVDLSCIVITSNYLVFFLLLLKTNGIVALEGKDVLPL